jgi:hypothetical protein
MWRAVLVVLGLVGCGGAASEVRPPAPVAPNPVPAGVWLTMYPRQVGNPWEGIQPGDTRTVGYPLPELENIDGFFEGKGIELVALGLLWSTEDDDGEHDAIDRPRGDVLLVIAKPADVDRLVAEWKFARVPAGLLASYPATQCGSPWGMAGAPIDEAQRLAQWAEKQGVPPGVFGFLFASAPPVRAQACGTPRGDWAVIGGGRSAAGRLRDLGFVASP